MFLQEMKLFHYGNRTKLHAFTMTGSPCITEAAKTTCFYKEWNSLQFGNSTPLRVCTRIGTFFSTVTAKRDMIVQGLELS